MTRHQAVAPACDLEKYLTDKLALVNRWLDDYTPEPVDGSELGFNSLCQSMRYSIFADGKRFRPILAIATCELLGGDSHKVAPLATAVEWVHTYSLIHDDLPCMDDDDLRRGKPTNHKVYGEALALLAGDALLTEAFGLITSEGSRVGLTAESLVSAITTLAKAAGCYGMVGGQVADMQAEERDIPVNVMRSIHSRKTGALIRAACQMGCIAAGGSTGDCTSIDEYAVNLGIAFQIADDILDVEGNESTIGKPVGSDQKNHKSTYISLFGLSEARKMAYDHAYLACDAIEAYGLNALQLAHLAYYVVDRRR